MGGMSAFAKEAITMIPQDEVVMLLFRKLEESNVLSSLLEQLNEEDFEKMCENFQVSCVARGVERDVVCELIQSSFTYSNQRIFERSITNSM